MLQNLRKRLILRHLLFVKEVNPKKEENLAEFLKI